MAEYMLYVGSHAIDDPTRAGLVFAAARAAIKAGYPTKIALLGDAVLLMKDAIAESTYLAKRGPVSGLIAEILEAKLDVEIHC